MFGFKFREVRLSCGTCRQKVPEMAGGPKQTHQNNCYKFRSRYCKISLHLLYYGILFQRCFSLLRAIEQKNRFDITCFYEFKSLKIKQYGQCTFLIPFRFCIRDFPVSTYVNIYRNLFSQQSKYVVAFRSSSKKQI